MKKYRLKIPEMIKKGPLCIAAFQTNHLDGMVLDDDALSYVQSHGVPTDWLEPIEDGPVSTVKIVQIERLKSRNGEGCFEYEKRLVQAGETNDRKRTQPAIDAAQKVFDCCSKFFESGEQLSAMMRLFESLQALKTLEENER
jgi:hypothetical protein